MTSTKLATDAEGRPLLVKEGDVEALRREAAVLAVARHPGVVEVASEADGRLVLRWVGGRTLADLQPPVERAAALAASLAATVTDLHSLGVRHGRITPSRVVLDAGGRPVLCGFAGAALRGEDGPTTADDVAGIGLVLRSLVGAEADLEPIPDSRFAPRRAWPGALRRALLTVADQATDDDPARRPSARVLAASIADLLPAPRPVAPSRRRFPTLVAIAAGAVVLGGIGVTSLDRGPTSRAATPVGEAIRAIECPSVEEPAYDHDGDGCPSAVVVDDGVVVVDGTRYGVGRPGDRLAVGDWDCDGAATVAAVRPATGEVFVFDGWAAPTGDVVVPAAARVGGAARLQADDGDGDGCPALVVVDVDGVRTTVPT
jgi:hypothetical protein